MQESDDILYKDRSDQQKRDRDYSYFFIFILCAIVVQLLFLNPTSFNEMVKKEVKASYAAIGENNWLNVTESSKRHFELIIVKTGFKKYYLDKVTRDTVDTNPIAKMFKKLMPVVKRFSNNLQIVTYQLAHRTNLLGVWIYILVPFILSQLVAGIYQWKIRAYTFGNKTKAKMLVIKKIIKLLVLLIILYFFLPCFYPEVAAYIPFLAIMSMSLLTTKFIATAQKHW